MFIAVSTKRTGARNSWIRYVIRVTSQFILPGCHARRTHARGHDTEGGGVANDRHPHLRVTLALSRENNGRETLGASAAGIAFTRLGGFVPGVSVSEGA